MDPNSRPMRIFLSLLTGMIALTGAITFTHAQDRKPNVVVMLADNMGYGDLGS